jgi:hypothetical protein
VVKQTQDNLEGLAHLGGIAFLSLGHTAIEQSAALGDPCSRARGFLHGVLGVDGVTFVVLSDQARLLEGLHLGKQVSLAIAIRLKRPWVDIARDELQELGLRQKVESLFRGGDWVYGTRSVRR